MARLFEEYIHNKGVNEGRIVLHSDLNNFFASVECKKRPELLGKPVAVCGNREDRHGIVLAKNETAKKYGVKTIEHVGLLALLASRQSGRRKTSVRGLLLFRRIMMNM